MPGAVVVGTGFGCRVHVPALRDARASTCIALVGRDAARTAASAPTGSESRTACTSLADALALDGVDAVTIATPPDTHAALAIEACAAGKARAVREAVRARRRAKRAAHARRGRASAA